MKVAIDWPNMCDSGSRFRNRIGENGHAYLRYFRISRSTGTILASTLRCVMTTPLGSAVAPDVKMISAVSSRVTDARSTAPVASPIQLVQAPHLGARAIERGRLDLLANQHQPRFDDRGDTPQKVGRRTVVDGNDDDALEQAGPERGNPFRAVFGPEDDGVALPEAGRRGAVRPGRGRRAPRRRTCAPGDGSRCRGRGTRREAAKSSKKSSSVSRRMRGL